MGPAGIERPCTDANAEARTGSDGRFVVCTLPSEQLLTVRMLIGDRWIDAFGVTLPHHDIVYRRVTVPSSN